MPLRVVFRAQYLSEPVPQMRPEDYTATHLVKAVKGLDLNAKSYTWVTIAGKKVKIIEANKDQAVLWFAEWAAPQIDALGAERKVLVPVPSSKTVPASAPDFRTARIANAIAAECRADAVVVPVLRFKQPMPSSREGGPRDPRVLRANMVMTDTLPQGQCVLIDDVLTSGGHLVAAAWMIEDQKRIVDLAVCCGRSTHHQWIDPLAAGEETLDLARW